MLKSNVSASRLCILLPLVAMAAFVLPVWADEMKSPLAEGKSLFESVCNKCHELDRSLGKKADQAGWEKTINQMISSGADFEEGQAELILGYLTAKSTFETRCNTCHNLERPLSMIKSQKEWKATVARMSAMKPKQITDAEAGAITLYLSLVTSR